ncbi:MAG: phosphatase PAP2 family protein [Fibrobacter sp.]|nr:phosphatase PAP2 family protein [Fibrobacter sp.]
MINNKYLLLLTMIMSIYLYAAPGVAFCSAGTSSSDSQSYFATIWSDIKDDGVLTLHNFKDLVRVPSKLTTPDIVAATVITGTFLLSFTQDNSIRNFALSRRSDNVDRFLRYGFTYGNKWPAVAIGGGLYVLGLGVQNDWLHETGRETLTALVMAGLFTGTMKYVIGRARPFKNIGNSKVTWFTLDDDYQSFPSGHATTAFTVSTVLASRINNPFASVCLYGLAFLTAAQRFNVDKHWFSDVIMGATIGTLTARFVVKDSDAFLKQKGSKVTLIPEFSYDAAAIRLCINY